MSSERKQAAVAVESIVEELKKNPSVRFSKSDFQTLVFGVLSDKDFKAKKYVVRNDSLIEEITDIHGNMMKFLDKLLKHTGISNSDQRAKILETFEYNARDVEWVSDAIDEAMAIYTDCGKNMRMFRDKMLQLTVKKIARSGKYDGKNTYKKTVLDRAAALQKKSKKG